MIEEEESVNLAVQTSSSDKYKEEMERQAEILRNKTKGYLMDLRPDSKFEKIIPYTFYMPLSVLHFAIMFCTAIVTLYLGLTLLCKRGDPTE